MAKNEGGWRASLGAVIRANNGRKEDGSTASFATQAKRKEVLTKAFKTLREKGFKLEDVKGFGGRHMDALAKEWQGQGLSASTLQNNTSVMRQFAEWIGKSGMVESSAHYFGDAATRTSINETDKSWSAQGVDVDAKIAEVAARDERLGLQLEGCKLFGLRVNEVAQLQPWISDKGNYLEVVKGTKGGRPRTVPITSEKQREWIEKAKALTEGNKKASTSDQSRSLAEVKAHTYYFLRACGITRENGLTAHGLRHEYAGDRYQELSGAAAPVRGGNLKATDRQTDFAARLQVSNELGHGREGVTTYYLGR